jgi:cyanophycinase-like exopeptidase
MARLLTLMGSGETAPAMAAVHRRLLERLGPPPVTGAIIDSPYSFQENAAEISARAVEWFERHTGVRMRVAGIRGPGQDPAEREEALQHLRDAAYIFSGPGSPSHALRLWHDEAVPAILAERLETGGAITLASAAALTVGAWTVPVYEIYKVGQEPFWLSGLDLLGPLGLSVAVIPHYDNAEGGTHDTRYCYVGERRLRVLEQDLPADHFILGIDSHTALILDLDAGTATVHGRGGVTVRAAGHSHVLPRGSTTILADLPGIAADLAARVATSGPPLTPTPRETLEPPAAPALSPTLEPPAASPLPAARPLPAALVDLLVEIRDRARRDHDWALSDRIRDALAEAGIELRDRADRTDWSVRPPSP